MANTNRIEQLFTQYLQRRATKPELQELGTLLQQTDAEQQLSPASQTLWNQIKQQNIQYPVDWDTIYNNTISTTEQAVVISLPTKEHKLFNWKKIAVAASILLVVGLGSYFAFFKPGHSGPDPESIAKDVPAPATNRAQITLADGTIVYLDSADNGTLATAGNVKVVKNEQGEIVYNGTATVMEYNTMFNPRGSKVQALTLSDGTKVWLNAESSIKYPIAFTGNTRTVEINGEAYFEVTHDASKKFIVTSNGVNTEVLGTHFNVNSYSDEADIKVTLLEGSVSVSSQRLSASAVKIKPGQQAVFNPDTRQLTTDTRVDLEQVLSWKNGTFSFDNADIKTILRQFARWYDVEVIYEGSISNRTFFGVVKRTSTLSEVLKILQANDIKFRIEQKKLYVTGG